MGQEHLFDKAFVQRGGRVKAIVNRYQPHVKGIVKANPNTPVMVYLMAGINDLTTMTRRRGYSETTFDMSSNVGTLHLKGLFDWAVEKLEATGAMVVVCQLPPMNIALWNQHGLDRVYSRFLLHEQRYPAMQAALEECVADINAYLVSCYQATPLVTPPLQRVVCPGKGFWKWGVVQKKWLRFKDGLHLRPQYEYKLAKVLVIALLHNENACLCRPLREV